MLQQYMLWREVEKYVLHIVKRYRNLFLVREIDLMFAFVLQRDKQLQASAMTASSSSSSASSAMFAMGDSTTTVGFGMRPPSSSAAAGIIQTASLSQVRDKCHLFRFLCHCDVV